MSPPAHHTIAADYRRSGKTQQDYCTDKNVSIHTLRYYLYKKPRRKYSKAPRHQQSRLATAAAPSCIIFNREAHSENTSRHSVTVIHGFFFVAELAEILSTASMRQ